MNYSEIKKVDVANGLGIRVSLFVSGCRNRCKGCFNSSTWDFNAGKLFDKQVEDLIIEYLKPDHIAGLSILGGDPFEEENQTALTNFLQKVKKIYPQKDIWCWTGYSLQEDLLNSKGKKHSNCTDKMLENIDYIIDGKFIEELKDPTLNYRGSSNQKIYKKVDNNWTLILL